MPTEIQGGLFSFTMNDKINNLLSKKSATSTQSKNPKAAVMSPEATYNYI